MNAPRHIHNLIDTHIGPRTDSPAERLARDALELAKLKTSEAQQNLKQAISDFTASPTNVHAAERIEFLTRELVSAKKNEDAAAQRLAQPNFGEIMTDC